MNHGDARRQPRQLGKRERALQIVDDDERFRRGQADDDMAAVIAAGLAGDAAFGRVSKKAVDQPGCRGHRFPREVEDSLNQMVEIDGHEGCIATDSYAGNVQV